MTAAPPQSTHMGRPLAAATETHLPGALVAPREPVAGPCNTEEQSVLQQNHGPPFRSGRCSAVGQSTETQLQSPVGLRPLPSLTCKKPALETQRGLLMGPARHLSFRSLQKHLV